MPGYAIFNINVNNPENYKEYVEKVKPTLDLETPTYRCPKCGAEIRWACSGNSGYAYCANSPTATRIMEKHKLHEIQLCDWTGKTRRRQDGKVEIYYSP